MLMVKCLMATLILVILMLILMLLNLNTGYADADTDLCSLCCEGCFVPSLVEINPVVLEKKMKMWKV